MLFQGQEFAASRPFLYFADHEPELAELVRKGRASSCAVPAASPTRRGADALPRSRRSAPRSSAASSTSAERERHAPAYALHRDLLRLRREDPVVRRAGPARHATARCSAPQASCCGSSATAERRPAAAREPRARPARSSPRPSRCSRRRRRAGAGRVLVVERGPALRRRRARRVDARAGGGLDGCPGRRPPLVPAARSAPAG